MGKGGLGRGVGCNDYTVLFDMVLMALFPFMLEFPMLSLIGIAVAVFVILTIANATPIGRCGRAALAVIMGWFGAGEKKLKNVNPIQQRANAVQAKREQVAKGEEGLRKFEAKRRANLQSLESAKQDVDRLTKRIRLAIAEKRQKDAESLALQLRNKRQAVVDYQKLEDDFAAEFKETFEMVEATQQDIREEQEQTELLAHKLEMAKTREVVAQIAAASNPDNMSAQDDALREATQVINDQINEAEAGASVTRQMNRSYFEERAEEGRIAAEEAKSILAEFSSPSSESADASTSSND